MDVHWKEGEILRPTREKRTGSEGVVARHRGRGRVFRRPVLSIKSLVETEALRCLQGVRPDIWVRLRR
jgi:hypothetical protein